MKLLLDANISWRLADKLKIHFNDCQPVDHIGIAVPASDTEIWEYAFENSMIIVTNDDDFLNLLNIKGFPPKVVLLSTGNQSNNYIESLLINMYLILGCCRKALRLAYWKLCKQLTCGNNMHWGFKRHWVLPDVNPELPTEVANKFVSLNKSSNNELERTYII